VAATFNWAIRNGAGGTNTDLGSSGNLQDFKSVDSSGISDYAANPITAGNNSFECWLRGHFSGTFNRIDDVRVWQSTNFSPSTGLQIFWSGTQVIFLQPSQATSSIATSSIPTADPGSANVSIGGSLSGSLTTSGFTDHVVLQLRTTTAAPAGDTSLTTITMSYTENVWKEVKQPSPISRNRLHRFHGVNRTDYEIKSAARLLL